MQGPEALTLILRAGENRQHHKSLSSSAIANGAEEGVSMPAKEVALSGGDEGFSFDHGLIPGSPRTPLHIASRLLSPFAESPSPRERKELAEELAHFHVKGHFDEGDLLPEAAKDALLRAKGHGLRPSGLRAASPLSPLETAIAAARKLEGLEGQAVSSPSSGEGTLLSLDKSLPPIKTKLAPTPPNEPVPDTESPPSHKRARELLELTQERNEGDPVEEDVKDSA